MEGTLREVTLREAGVFSAATLAQFQVVAYNPATQSTVLFAQCSGPNLMTTKLWESGHLFLDLTSL